MNFGVQKINTYSECRSSVSLIGVVHLIQDPEDIQEEIDDVEIPIVSHLT
jgi:hypothetical protein